MSSTAAWILILMAVAAAAIIGFYAGRHTAPGKHQVDSLRKELDESRQAMTDYRQSVNRHFEKTATLFTSMAGSYRELYDHLRESYGDLTDSPEHPLLPDRAGALLEGKNPPAPGPADQQATHAPGESPQQEPARHGAAGPDADSEDMMGDAPYIPADVDLEDSPDHPIKAQRDDHTVDTADTTATASAGDAGEPGVANSESAHGDTPEQGDSSGPRRS